MKVSVTTESHFANNRGIYYNMGISAKIIYKNYVYIIVGLKTHRSLESWNKKLFISCPWSVNSSEQYIISVTNNNDLLEMHQASLISFRVFRLSISHYRKKMIPTVYDKKTIKSSLKSACSLVTYTPPLKKSATLKIIKKLGATSTTLNTKMSLLTPEQSTTKYFVKTWLKGLVYSFKFVIFFQTPLLRQRFSKRLFFQRILLTKQ